jgi:hypothetical protein
MPRKPRITRPAVKKSQIQSCIARVSVDVGGDPMPATARAKELPSENLSLEGQIQRRAYELSVERGNQSGSELDDWLQAETEILKSQEQAFAAKR